MVRLSTVVLCIRAVLLFLGTPLLLPASPMADSLSNSAYYERIEGDRIRLFYDERYYLVEKDCHYKAIEREGQYDFANKSFVGEVRDYDLNGYLVLEGNYVQGKKEGLFRAYHPSGFLKWEITYLQDMPTDTLRFYYPDGMPYLEYRIVDGELLLWNYWNQRGRQRAKEGRGRFEVVIEANDVYDPIGHRWIKRTGRVRGGKLHLTIPYHYVFEDGTDYLAGYEEYNEGTMVRRENYMSVAAVLFSRTLPIVPRIWHVRSELMVSKRCTVDDHIGFTEYAAKEWQTALLSLARVVPDDEGNIQLYLVDDKQQWSPVEYSLRDLGVQHLSFVLEVDKEGAIQSVVSDNNFDTPPLAEHMIRVIKDFGYWMPSWNGDFIDDELTVEVKVVAVPQQRSFVLYDLHVIRKDGT